MNTLISKLFELACKHHMTLEIRFDLDPGRIILYAHEIGNWGDFNLKGCNRLIDPTSGNLGLQFQLSDEGIIFEFEELIKKINAEKKEENKYD